MGVFAGTVKLVPSSTLWGLNVFIKILKCLWHCFNLKTFFAFFLLGITYGQLILNFIILHRSNLYVHVLELSALTRNEWVLTYDIFFFFLSYTKSTWTLLCTSSTSSRCSDTNYVEPFQVSASVRFIKVPANTPEPKIRSVVIFNNIIYSLVSATR